MENQIKGNVQMTVAMKAYVQEKIMNRLGNFGTYISEVSIDLSHQKDTYTASVLMQLKGRTIKQTQKVEVSDSDMYSAIDKVSDKAVRQVRKFKERVKDNFHGHETLNDHLPKEEEHEEIED